MKLDSSEFAEYVISFEIEICIAWQWMNEWMKVDEMELKAPLFFLFSLTDKSLWERIMERTGSKSWSISFSNPTAAAQVLSACQKWLMNKKNARTKWVANQHLGVFRLQWRSMRNLKFLLKIEKLRSCQIDLRNKGRKKKEKKRKKERSNAWRTTDWPFVRVENI